MRVAFPIVEIEGVSTFGIREPKRAQKFELYEVTFDDVNLIGSPLETIARRLYGSDRLWPILVENNVLKHPLDWQVGDIIRIPTWDEIEPLLVKMQARS